MNLTVALFDTNILTYAEVVLPIKSGADEFQSLVFVGSLNQVIKHPDR